MMRTLTTALIATALLTSPAAVTAQTQEKPRPRPAARPAPVKQSHGVQVGGFALFGNIDFTATESFDAIVGKHTGQAYGGGAHIGLPWGGLFAEVGAWRFHATGERVFPFNGESSPLGIKDTITVTPIEFSAGWQFRFRTLPKFIPYVAAGLTSMRYQETSDFAAANEDIDQNYGGYHLRGGAEYKIVRWLGVAGEAQWTTIPNAIGDGGVSKTFGETDLGGTSLRFKITIGR